MRVVAPAGHVVAAPPPAAVGAGNVEVSQRVADVCLGALAQAVPDRVGAASQGTMNNLLIGGERLGVLRDHRRRPGRPPGRPAGMSGVHTGMTNTQNTPIEAFERAFPMRVRRYRLRRGSGGAGRCPGGDGIERTSRCSRTCTVSPHHRAPGVASPGAWPVAGPAPCGENWLLPGGDEARAERLPDKCTIRLRAGDVLRMLTPGGGGYGSRPG